MPARVGRYVVQAELGRGAMGVVYRAVDPALDRPVALKLIDARSNAARVATEELEARFLREARLAAKINHPGVVTVHDAGRDGKSLFLVMELVDGESLADRIARGDYPRPAEALGIVADAAEALAVAHALGVVHRDVKPGNIMLTRNGRTKVADFGIAKAVGEDSTLTHSGTVVGSPAYMSPEQVRGEALDGRADLFSLGVVLFELLLHRLPFPAQTVTTLIYQILHLDPIEEAQASTSLPPEVAAFLRHCLSKSRSDRIPDGLAFAARARELAAGARLTSPEDTAPRSQLAEVGSPTAGGSNPPGPATVFAPAPDFTPTTTMTAAPPPFPPPVPPRDLPQETSPVAPAATVAAPDLPAPDSTSAAGTPAVHPATPPEPAAGQHAPPGDRRGLGAVAAILGGGTFLVFLMLWGVTRRDSTLTTRPLPTAGPVVQATAPAPAPTPTEPPVVATFHCSRGADFNVSPEDAHITIDGKDIGIADDWDNAGGGRTYVFASPGTYFAKLSLRGHRTAWVKIVVSPEAKTRIADIDTSLQELK